MAALASSPATALRAGSPRAGMRCVTLAPMVQPRSLSGAQRRAPSRAHQSMSARRGMAALSVRASALGPEGDGNVKPIESKADFDRYLSEAAGKLVVLDIATKTCGPCKFIYPKVVKLSLEYEDIVFLKIFGDLNDETRALMREWGVRAVPNFRFYLNGELVHSYSGAKEDELKISVQKYHSQTVTV